MYEARGQVAAAFEGLQGFKGLQGLQPDPAAGVGSARIASAALAPPQAGPGAEAMTAPVPAAPPTAWTGDLPISLLALATSGTQVRARLKDSDGAELYVTGVRYKNSSLKVRLTAQAVEPSEAGSWYDVSAIDEFDTTS